MIKILWLKLVRNEINLNKYGTKIFVDICLFKYYSKEDTKCR